jgi:lysophospholipase
MKLILRSFVNLGLNSRPTFFGCNASNFTDYSRTPPLVIYFPHTPWTAYTNFSTFTLEYTQDQVAAFIQNGVATAVISSLLLIDVQSQGNSTTWPACLACAVLQRAKERAGVPMGDQCQKCFQEYCWDGTLNTTLNAYNPVLRSDNATFQTAGQAGTPPARKSGAEIVRISTSWGLLTASLAFMLL